MVELENGNVDFCLNSYTNVLNKNVDNKTVDDGGLLPQNERAMDGIFCETLLSADQSIRHKILKKLQHLRYLEAEENYETKLKLQQEAVKLYHRLEISKRQLTYKDQHIAQIIDDIAKRDKEINKIADEIKIIGEKNKEIEEEIKLLRDHIYKLRDNLQNAQSSARQRKKDKDLEWAQRIINERTIFEKEIQREKEEQADFEKKNKEMEDELANLNIEFKHINARKLNDKEKLKKTLVLLVNKRSEEKVDKGLNLKEKSSINLLQSHTLHFIFMKNKKNYKSLNVKKVEKVENSKEKIFLNNNERLQNIDTRQMILTKHILNGILTLQSQPDTNASTADEIVFKYKALTLEKKLKNLQSYLIQLESKCNRTANQRVELNRKYHEKADEIASSKNDYCTINIYENKKEIFLKEKKRHYCLFDIKGLNKSLWRTIYDYIVIVLKHIKNPCKYRNNKQPLLL